MRNKYDDSIFLRNFFKDRIGFFTGDQPAVPDAYIYGYNLATQNWYPLKSEIDTYPISFHVKNNLIKLFELGEIYFYYACSHEPWRSTIMSQRWNEIRQIARVIYNETKLAGLFTE